MNNLSLIVYSGKSGSTQAAATAISQAMEKQNIPTRCVPVAEVTDIAGVDRVIIGTPIYYGKCPPDILQFLSRYETELSKIRVLMFFTCLRLTHTGEEIRDINDIHIDPQLSEPFKPFKNMGMMEKSHSAAHYLNQLGPGFNRIRVSSLAFFKGNLNFGGLDLKSRVVMRIMSYLMEQVSEGEFLNHETAAQWALARIGETSLPKGGC
ncbi:MAG: hypothetical protein GY737_02685 [Desulfobacteraceae bacterium]|nr:hypothetical protein [Desulfobacteraceae bacterium]